MLAKHKRFVQEYLIDLNATKAAERAGYSPKSAHVTACRLLKDAKVAAAIEQATAKRVERTQITQDYVLSTIQDTVERCRMGGDGFEPPSVLKGCELLGKHLKMFTDKVEVSGSLAAVADDELDRRLDQTLVQIRGDA